MNFETELNMLVHVRFVHTFRNTPVSDGEEFKFELCLELMNREFNEHEHINQWQVWRLLMN